MSMGMEVVNCPPSMARCRLEALVHSPQDSGINFIWKVGHSDTPTARLKGVF